jgi:crotonobetainyl-CoA:carnitine CoA-transferase CaiB-like acyl-CoA transferase
VRAVFAQLSAWGQTGPMSENPGYDAGAYWAASGLQDYMRTDEGAEPPRFPGGIGDHTASMQLFGGVALALFHRQNTGEGTLVDANLLRAGLWVSECRQTQAHQSAPSCYGLWC